MANGPLGGNMGSAPVPPQPPQVSFTTTAESRGGFNNFLKSIPSTTAMTPIPPLGSAPTAPMSNPMGNIDIFNQPPSTGMGMMGMNQPPMNPMMQQPMQQQPMQPPMMGGIMGTPVQNFYDGGFADSDFGGFSDYGSVDATSDDGFSEDNDVSDYSTDDSGVYTGDNSSNMGLDDDVVAQNIIQNALNEGINQSTTQDSGSNNVNIAPRINSQIMGSEEDIFQDDINRDIAGSLTNREAANMMPNASNFGSRAAPNIAGAFKGGNNASLLGPEDALIDAITKGRSDLYAPFTNNPGNLKQAREDLTTETIKGFNADGTPRTGPALFNTLEAGQKALDDQLSSYGNRGINTATDFVNTYLGTDIKENPLENKQGYLSAVRNAVGDNFNLSNPATRTNITNAITRQEIGQKGINALNNQVTAATGLDQAFNAPITSAPNVNANTSPPPPGFEEAVGTPGVLRQGDQIRSAKDFEFAFTPKGITPKEQAELRELRDIDDAEFAPNTTDIFSPSASDFANFQNTRDQLPNFGAAPTSPGRLQAQFGNTLGAGVLTPEEIAQSGRIGTREAEDFLNAMNMPGTAIPLSQLEKDRITNVNPINTINRINRNNRTIDEIKADMGSRVPDTALETMEGRVGPTDTVFDIDTNVVDRNSDLDALRSRGTPVDTIFDIDTTDTRNFVGNDAFDDSTFIENPLNMVEAGGMGIPAPKEFKDPFPNAGIGAIPTLTSLANKFSAYSRGRVLDSIAQKGYTPVYDGDVIVGAKNKFGQLMEGMDPNAPMNTGDDNNENPLILRPIAKAPEEEKEEEKLPNVIGGGETPAPVSSGSVVVDSPFTTNVGDYSPTGFDGGDLNALIARLLKTSNPKKAAQGGVIGYQGGGQVMQALDNLLATG